MHLQFQWVYSCMIKTRFVSWVTVQPLWGVTSSCGDTVIEMVPESSALSWPGSPNSMPATAAPQSVSNGRSLFERICHLPLRVNGRQRRRGEQGAQNRSKQERRRKDLYFLKGLKTNTAAFIPALYCHTVGVRISVWDETLKSLASCNSLRICSHLLLFKLHVSHT